jgi:DNA-binding MarR family transcriptional regulator
MHYIGGMSQNSSRVAASVSSQGCTCAKLRRLTRRITAVYDRELAAAGLRVTQFSLLAALRSDTGAEGVGLTELAERMDMDRSTLSRNLRPLITHGWAELVAHGQDARVRVARLTLQGLAQWQAARPYWKRAQNEVNATLGAAQVLQLHQQLDEVTPLFRPAETSQDD